MKITASISVKNEWSTSNTRYSEEDDYAYFSGINYDSTIAYVIADLLYMSKHQIANMEYTIACIVSDALDPGHQEYDEETQELSHKLYLAAEELKNHIEACHKARQQQ